jgi:hypothetical protein
LFFSGDCLSWVDENLPVVAKKGNAEERVDENEHLPVVKKDKTEERVDENEHLPVVKKDKTEERVHENEHLPSTSSKFSNMS